MTVATAVAVLTPSGGQGMFPAPLAWAIFVLAGLVVSAPPSLVLGAPLLWRGQAWVLRRPLAATLMLTVVGLLIATPLPAWTMEPYDRPEIVTWAIALFGGMVAGLHGAVLVHHVRRRWSRTLLLVACVGVLSGGTALLLGDERRARAAVEWLRSPSQP